MKKLLGSFAILAVALTANTVIAQEGVTWQTQETVMSVTTIRIFPNAEPQYLNNLKRTWVTDVEEAIKEGLTTEYHIYQTVTGNDGGYNLVLVTVHPNLAAFDATDENRAKGDRINERVEALISDQETDEITANVYPQVREILSEKLIREIKFID